MESSFLTIAEACAKTARSPSTIRRIIHGIASDPSSHDRKAVEPSPAKAATLKKKGENFTWRIREDILLRAIGGAQAAEKKSSSKGAQDALAILQRELVIKNQQIEKQWEVIQALNERLREGNILMGALHRRLALPDPLSTEGTAEASMVTVTAEPVFPTKKASTKVSMKPSKRWLFRFLRRNS